MAKGAAAKAAVGERGSPAGVAKRGATKRELEAAALAAALERRERKKRARGRSLIVAAPAAAPAAFGRVTEGRDALAALRSHTEKA